MLGKAFDSPPLMQHAKISIMRTYKKAVMGPKLLGEKRNHYKKCGATSKGTKECNTSTTTTIHFTPLFRMRSNPTKTMLKEFIKLIE